MSMICSSVTCSFGRSKKASSNFWGSVNYDVGKTERDLLALREIGFSVIPHLLNRFFCQSLLLSRSRSDRASVAALGGPGALYPEHCHEGRINAGIHIELFHEGKNDPHELRSLGQSTQQLHIIKGLRPPSTKHALQLLRLSLVNLLQQALLNGHLPQLPSPSIWSITQKI